MAQTPYRGLSIGLRIVSVLLGVGGLFMIFSSKPLILRVMMHPPESEVSTLLLALLKEMGGVMIMLSVMLFLAARDPARNVAILDALSRGRLVGRADELAEARELWRRAQEGRGHCLLLSGEPGSGKTRLAREVIVQATLDGAVVLSGACYEYEAATPYLPFVEAFRRWVREQKDDAKLKELIGESALSSCATPASPSARPLRCKR